MILVFLFIAQTVVCVNVFDVISVLRPLKFKIWRLTFFKSFLPLKHFWDGLPEIMETPSAH